MIWIRWTLPRLRIDQVMTMCLKYCIPLVAAMFVGAMLFLYLFPEGILRHFFPGGARAGASASVARAASQEELQIANGNLPSAAISSSPAVQGAP
jgi:NADH-quinone oxidoreductase subunit H